MLSDQQFDFFRTFPDFRPQQSAEPEHEFNRLAAARQWKIAGKKYRRYQREFQILEDIADSHENSLERRLESLYLSSPHSVNNDACNGRYDLLEALGGVTLGAQSHNSDSSTALEGLQQLCVDLRCDLPAPPTITQCKKFLSGVFVNICDYIECKRQKQPVEPIFQKRSQLTKYTVKTGKIFSKKVAKRHPVLKALLEVLH